MCKAIRAHPRGWRWLVVFARAHLRPQSTVSAETNQQSKCKGPCVMRRMVSFLIMRLDFRLSECESSEREITNQISMLAKSGRKRVKKVSYIKLYMVSRGSGKT